MSTWFVDDKRTWLQKQFGEVLKCGQLPKHIAIIMDGNRRYAKSRNIQKIEGHLSGFEKLVEALSWCFAMDVKEVTVYAFSIENFKRSQDEVDALFDLAREKFQRLLNEQEKIDEMGVRIRMIGELNLLPHDLQEIIAKVMENSQRNDKLFMNVCIAYTSREEMTTVVRDLCAGVKQKQIDLMDINESLIEKCLYTSGSYDVDLLVRTSGEVRLSDFLLWQSSFSALSFVKKTWPEFSIWNFYMGILNYQLNYDNITKLKAARGEKLLKDLDIACRMHAIENRKQLVEQVKQKEIESNIAINNINNNNNNKKSSPECFRRGGGGKSSSSTSTASTVNPNLQLQQLVKHVASEAVEKCHQEHIARTSHFVNDLNAKRVNRLLKTL